MEINYANFFSAGKPMPDLQSIVTHELGHLLGLDHSCSGTATSGMPACNQANTDYVNALMYPALGFNGAQGQVSRTIRTNDQQRANCLY